MKTTQKKSVKIVRSHSLCKKVSGGVGTSKGDSSLKGGMLILQSSASEGYPAANL